MIESDKPTRTRNIVMATLRVTCLVALVCTVGAGFFLYSWLDQLNVFAISEEDVATIVTARVSDNTLVFDRNKEKIGEFFQNYHVFVPYDDLPPSLVKAILAIEDRNFYSHQGYDAKAIVRAALARLTQSRYEQGASTITQQIVRHFLLPKERTLTRKVQEIFLAYHLEKKISKERILEIYANHMFLGAGSYGVGAAAHRYFGKKVSELTIGESALIAGLFQSPSRYNPMKHEKRALARQRIVLKAMLDEKLLSRKQWKEARQSPLAYQPYSSMHGKIAPFFIDYVKEELPKILAKKHVRYSDGLRVYTTLDLNLQNLAEDSIRNQDKMFLATEKRVGSVLDQNGKEKAARLEAAVLSTDPKTGEILAMVGGRNYSGSQFNRTVHASRSPGSAFKPVLYSEALKQHWKWSDMMYVSPVTVGTYRPRTPDEDYLSETTLFRAFFRSMNAPAIELAQKIGLKAVIDHAKALGIQSPIKTEFGSILGSSETTMLDLARVYSTFAAEGLQTELVAITRVEDRSGKVIYEAPTPDKRQKAALSRQNAYLMTQAMRAVLQMGTGAHSAHLSRYVAGKTGTANDSTDNWFCGYSTNLTTIVWVGTDEHKAIFGDVTGGKLALPIFDDFMTRALAKRKPQDFQVPPGIVAARVHPRYGSFSDQGIRMYFIRGNEPLPGTSPLESLSGTSVAGSENYRGVFTHQ